jgi:2-oxoglutarate ferredoxin oxidoreductase subunit beta
MWAVTQQYGNIDPTFDPAALAKGAGATFIGRESVSEAQKLERLFVKGFQHKGFSFFDIHSNCHVNFGRKNKMGTAKANLEWINGNLMNKNQWDKMTPEEQHEARKAGKFPKGILWQVEEPEYCELYDTVIEKAGGNK